MKTAVVTGADGGMGTEITKAVAQAGYHVIMACRDQARGEHCKNGILLDDKGLSLEVMQIDLASFGSVAAFAGRLAERGTEVSLLMNNAGTMCTCAERTADGIEKTVSVNYAGPYLLTRRLVPLMPHGARIVNMVSCTYATGRITFPEFFTHGKTGEFWRIPIYGNSKLALLLFTFELADRLKGTGITVNAADPGIVSTEIIRMDKWFDPLTDIFFRPFIRKPAKGASTAVGLLLDDRYECVSGALCVNGNIKVVEDGIRYHPLRRQLWEETEKIVGTFL